RTTSVRNQAGSPAPSEPSPSAPSGETTSWAISSEMSASAVSGNVCALHKFTKGLVVSVAVPPVDVAADHAGLGPVGFVVGAVEGEVAQGGELGLDPVEPAGVEGDVGQFDVVGLGPVPDPAVGLRGQVGTEVVEHDGDPDVGRVQRAHVAAEGEELGPALLGRDVAVEPVG